MKSTITLKRPDQARKYNLARSHSKCGRLIYRQINGPYWYPIVWSRFIELSGNDAKEVTWFLSRDQFKPSHICLRFWRKISSKYFLEWQSCPPLHGRIDFGAIGGSTWRLWAACGGAASLHFKSSVSLVRVNLSFKKEQKYEVEWLISLYITTLYEHNLGRQYHSNQIK